MRTLIRAASALLLVWLVAAAPNDVRFRHAVSAVAGGERAADDPLGETPRVATASPDVRRIEAANAVGANAFELVLDASPDAMSRAFLVYELAGVRHWTGAVRSINGLPALGGFGAAPSSGAELQIEEINPRWLRFGTNHIQFFPAPAAERPPTRVSNLQRTDAIVPFSAVPYTVRNLRLVYLDGAQEPAPQLRLSHPVQGENDGAGAVLRGFVDPANVGGKPAELFVDNVYVPHGIGQADGSFAVFVPRGAASGEAWETQLEVVYPDGTRLRRTVRLTGETSGGDAADAEDRAEREVGPGSDEFLSIGKARLRVRGDELAEKVKLTMRRLRSEELPAMDAGMTNVTPRGGGFRFGPHGLRFKKPVELSLPYDAALIPRGMTVDDIRTFYFDEEAGRWFAVPRVDANAGEQLIVSATDHFTDFVNATLALPDEPAGANHTSNSLKELAKADPASNIVQIEPPDAVATGDATLDFPIVIPPGRQGMQPALNVRYNSGGGNGWLGVGWDLRIPSIEVSTLFGVPRYDGTERYLIDGEQLVATSGNVFVRRSEGQFDRIVRHGSGPGDYWWEVTDKNGTKFRYGRGNQARLRDASNIFRWYLEQAVDLHGNTVEYTYVTDRGSNGEPWSEVYPAAIEYTGGPGVAAFYRVDFHLDGGSRPDRLSSGRQGFKTYTRYRLASIDVKAGAEIVRQYAFSYRTGDFQKSLLSAIVVKGEGGAEFYRHTFDYSAMAAVDAKTYDGFAAEQAWSGIGGSNDLTASRRAGGGAHGFAGLGPPGCQPHAGIQVGGSGTDTTQSVTFVDVNGDGLPDRLSDSGRVDLNAYDPVTDGARAGRFSSTSFANADTPGHTSEWTLDAGVGVHAEFGITAALDASFVYAHANDDHMVADVNGDFRPDLVSTDGGFNVRINDGHSFSTKSWSGYSAANLSLSSAEEEKEVLSKFHLTNPIRQLVLPWNGRVTLSGAIRKKAPAGDGVEVAIYHNANRVWSRGIGANDTSPCVPGAGNSCNGGLAVDVKAGDSLFFLAESIRDTTGDALAWAPVVTYDGANAEALEPYGAKTYVFDAAKDFSLAGYRGASWSAPAKGTIRITGALNKQQTSDDVVVTASHFQRNTGFVVPLFSRTFAASEVTSFADFPAATVGTGDLLYLAITSRTPVDPSRVQWTPAVTYEGATDPADLDDKLRSQPAQVAMPVPQFEAKAPTQSWIASGEQTFDVACSGSGATFYVQGVNRLFATREAVDKFEVKVDAAAGEALYFSVVSESPFVPAVCNVDGGKIPVNVLWKSDAKRVLSGGHHGWFYGDWNGNVAFNANGLTPPKDEDDERDYVAAAPHWESANWTASGFDLYLAADGMKPSRKGANAAGVLDEASGVGAGGSLSVLRKTTSKTVSVSASAGVGVSLSFGDSETQLDLIDMNGDRYPDQVSAGGVRFSNGVSGFDALQAFPGLGSSVRETEDVNASTSIGIGINFTKKNGKGKATAVLSTLPSVGSTVSLSQVTYDLVDVNGDGLPDRVSMTPGSDSVTVRLNLGYRFGAAETWTLPSLPATSRCGDVIDTLSSVLGSLSHLDSLNGLSFTRTSAAQLGIAIGPFGGGASTSLARTLVELADVNGDGLPDRVAKDEGQDYFRVQINLGDRWAAEERWRVPAWSTSIGDGYNPTVKGASAFQCLDAVSFSGHVEVNGSVGAPICIPLVPPTVVAGLQIEISAQGFGSIRSGMQLFLQDLDGDGLADHVLKKAGDASVYVKRNLAAGVNLLKTVHRPLGSTIELAYERRGNHAGNPFSHWVLGDVTVSDGRGNAYRTRVDYSNDNVYDRDERESYGYGSVKITHPDGSIVRREFANDNLYSRFLKTKETITDASGNLFVAETSTYREDVVASSSRFPALIEETTSFYEGTTSVETNAPKSTRRTYQYDTNGNVTRTTNYADAGNDDDVITAISYQLDSETRLTRPASIQVTDGTGKLLRSRHGTYDAAGDLTRLEQILAGGRDPDTGAAYSGSKNAVWTYTHDAFGNRVSIVDPSGFTSTVTYDATTRTYPIEVRDSFGYVTRSAYDLKHGAVTDTTDQNNNTIRRVYDRFGRVIRIVGPYDDDAAPTLSFEYGPGAPVSWAVVRHKDATRSDTINSATFIDSLGRVLQTKEDAELDLGSSTSTRTGMRVSGRVAFDAKGRVASQGQPVFDDKPANQFVDIPSKNPTTFTYDVLDRVRAVRFPHNATTSVKHDFASLGGTTRFLTTRTDPNGRATRFYSDVSDNVLAVEQTNTIAGAKKTLTTRYTYDALDQLLAVTDARGNTTRVEYDTLGRRVVVDNPDLGRVEHRYDPAGNLKAKITANLAAAGQQIRYLYTFDRLDRIDYPQSPDVTFHYGGPGAPNNRANRIAIVADASGVEERSYGRLGEVVQTVKTTNALNGNTPKGPFVTRFESDSFGRMLSVVYPDGETLTYGYDAGGQVKSASGVLKGVRFEYLRHLGYDEFGQDARMVLGNGVETRYTYDPRSRFLTQLRATGAGRDLQNLRYQHDPTGTILSQQNDVPVPNPSLYGGPVTQTFQYDDLYQLTGAQGTYQSGPNKTSAYALALAYDEIGNTISKNQLHQTGSGKLNVEKKTSYDWAYTYAGPRPHAATRIGERTFRYDANGNQTGWDSDTNGTRRALVWDEENRLASVSDNGQTTRFLYDTDGTRTNKAGPHGETIYLNRWFTLRNGAIASKHVYADDKRLATKVSPDPDPPSEKVYFFQADYLGSTQFVTDELGTVFQHLEYFPTGEIWVDERSETQRTPYLFSGKELDEETGLSYFGHRYYDARQGQWISADPILDEMLSVARLTRDSSTFDPFFLPGHIYAYTSNDPTNLIDPDGLVPHKPIPHSGGVYKLVRGKKVFRTGRATDLFKRSGQHHGTYANIKFKVVFETDDYNEQRGLEDVAYNVHEATAAAANGGENKIRALRSTNKKRGIYWRAALKVLRAQTGQEARKVEVKKGIPYLKMKLKELKNNS